MDNAAQSFYPPAPIPHKKPLNAVQFVLTASRNPLEIWGERAYREPILSARWMGNPTIIVSDPAAIRYLLVENAANYGMQPLRQRVLRPMLRDGLLTAEGELWRRTRRAISPIFAPRNILGLAGSMEARTTQFAEGLASRAGQTIDVAVEMTLLAYDILQTTLFTGDIAGEPAEFAAAVSKFLRTMGHADPLDILGAPAFLPRPTRMLGQRTQGYLRQLIADTIGRRRALLRRDASVAPADLLTLLLQTGGLSPTEIEDNVITFIGAGHETTARALGWTLYLLSQAPQERDKVEAELDAELAVPGDPASWPDRLIHTRAVFEEAMRLYPPAPSLNRTALADDRVGAVEIPKGASVLVLPWVVHRHEKLWVKPRAFMPSRFLPENREKLDRYQYLPFGVGPRVCIGQSFAMQEGTIALAALLRRLRFDYVGTRPPFPVQKITVQPQGGLPMRVSVRG
jgi:cytochrome P450